MGIQNNLKILGSADCVLRVISSNPFWKFLRLGNSAWDNGIIFGPEIFLGFVGSPRDFFGFFFKYNRGKHRSRYHCFIDFNELERTVRNSASLPIFKKCLFFCFL